MTDTYGLTHIAVAVRDLARTRRFYEAVLGAVTVYENETMIQLQTPGCHDAIVFELNEENAGNAGGIAHFGFRLRDAAKIDDIAAAVSRAGGTITKQGAFCDGEPYVFFNDPDGYEVEVWYELPTPVDPKE